jgi:DNA polymerase-3 subunit delta'
MAGTSPSPPGPEPGPGLVGVLGHAQAQAAVVRALGRGQLHHALVLVGPRGVGKATFARGLGCALLCPQRPGTGCGACPTCQRVLAGNHPDVDWLVPDSKAGLISVDAARACHVRQTHAPYEGRAYLVVVDPADALGEAAGNALLKTIEEPRPGVHFALLTTNLQGVLPTILSRSLPVRLGRLDDDIVRSIVAARAGDAAAERSDMAVLLAEGSAGVALELASDPSLARSLELVKQAITAVRAGPPAIFGGDTHPLWLAWTAATAPSEAVPEDSPEAAEPEPAGAKKKKTAKKAAKAGGEAEGGEKAASKKDAPALQRAAVRRLVELWILHVREQLRGRPGLPGLPPPPAVAPGTLVAAITALQRLGARVERMGNVRLMLEQGLLEQSALLAGT